MHRISRNLRDFSGVTQIQETRNTQNYADVSDSRGVTYPLNEVKGIVIRTPEESHVPAALCAFLSREILRASRSPLETLQLLKEPGGAEVRTFDPKRKAIFLHLFPPE
jgi:hypothetical protein